MPLATEGLYDADFLKEEWSQNFCRENRTVLAGSGSARTILTGTLVADVRTGVAAAVAGNTGNGAVTLGALGRRAELGVYTLVCITAATNAGTFEVLTPTGAQLGTNVVVAGGATNVNDHFTITLADGATDFIVGDSFTVTISAGKIVAYSDVATDTTRTPIGVMLSDVVAADGVDSNGPVLLRGPAIISQAGLIFPSGISAANKAAAIAALAARNILTVTGA